MGGSRDTADVQDRRGATEDGCRSGDKGDEDLRWEGAWWIWIANTCLNSSIDGLNVP